jgi:hypothetical protein
MGLVCLCWIFSENGCRILWVCLHNSVDIEEKIVLGIIKVK